ncbi:MAG: PspC domain-containing protein [Usitatibacter sp.]
MHLADDLQKLQTLREQGALTEEEFRLAKKRLLEAAADGVESKGEPSREPQSALNQFRRSITDRWLGGVCGGLAEMSSLPSWSWRILFVLTAFLHGLGVIMYVLLWIFVPVMAPQPVTPSRQ